MFSSLSFIFYFLIFYLLCPSLGALATAIEGGAAGVSAKLSYVFIGVNALAFPDQIAHGYFNKKTLGEKNGKCEY